MRYKFINLDSIQSKQMDAVRSFANKNGHIEVQTSDSADFYYYSIGPGKVSIDNFGSKPLRDAWIDLSSDKELDQDSIYNLFIQCLSNDESVSKTGHDIMFSLSGKKYQDLHQILASIQTDGFAASSSAKEYLNIIGRYLLRFTSIVKEGNNHLWDTHPKMLPIVILRYLQDNILNNKSITIPIINKVFENSQHVNPTLKINIRIE